MLGDRNLDLDFFIADTEFILNVLGRSEALEVSTVDHDAHLCREALCFIDQPRREDDRRRLVLTDLDDHRLHETTGLWVHARRRFVQDDDWRVTHQRNPNGELAFVTTRERS